MGDEAPRPSLPCIRGRGRRPAGGIPFLSRQERNQRSRLKGRFGTRRPLKNPPPPPGGLVWEFDKLSFPSLLYFPFAFYFLKLMTLPFGRAQIVEKASQSSPPQRRIKSNHFLSGRVPDRKYFTPRKCASCAPSALLGSPQSECFVGRGGAKAQAEFPACGK